MSDLNLKLFLGMNSEEFSPNYQFEKSEQFRNYVDYYMERYFDESKPEEYLRELRRAVRFANKSVLLDNLGLGYHEDLETQNPQLFKSMFSQLASEDPNLLVKGESVYYTPDLMKSFAEGTESENEYYEKLWLKTCEALKTPAVV